MNGSLHTSGATRAVLAHADPTVREALRDLTMQGLGMEVVGEAGDQATLRDQVGALRPDLVIVAWQLVTADPAGALRELRHTHDEARVVVLGPRPDKRQAALAAGADAYISMVDAPDVVAAALKRQEPGGLS
jgi:DNA-binding NarL/FixJ family response regulator